MSRGGSRKIGRKFGPHTIEHNIKISNSLKGRIPWNKGRIGISESTRQKHREKMLGNKHALGYHHTDKTKQLLSNSQIGIPKPENSKPMKESTKQKIKNKLIGRVFTKEHRRKLSVALQGKVHTMEQNQKVSESLKKTYLEHPELVEAFRQRMTGRLGSMKGKHHTLKTRAILSEIAKKQFQNPKMKELLRLNRRKITIPVKDSKPERMMQLSLTLHKIPFEKHKPLIGQPDIFIEPNICVFVDGDYWHANPKKYDSEKLIFGNYKAKDIWAKDLRVHHELNQQGYQVIRIWESDIKKNVNNCAINIIKLIQELRGVTNW